MSNEANDQTIEPTKEEKLGMFFAEMAESGAGVHPDLGGTDTYAALRAQAYRPDEGLKPSADWQPL